MVIWLCVQTEREINKQVFSKYWVTCWISTYVMGFKVNFHTLLSPYNVFITIG